MVGIILGTRQTAGNILPFFVSQLSVVGNFICSSAQAVIYKVFRICSINIVGILMWLDIRDGKMIWIRSIKRDFICTVSFKVNIQRSSRSPIAPGVCNMNRGSIRFDIIISSQSLTGCFLPIGVIIGIIKV